MNFCPKCNEPLRRIPFYDPEKATFRYPCSNKECAYVLIAESTARKRETMLRLTPLDKKRIRGEVLYASEMPKKGRS